jgi:hypothetical protein
MAALFYGRWFFRTTTGSEIGRHYSTDPRNRLKAIPAFFRNHLRISLPALNFPTLMPEPSDDPSLHL